MNERDFFTRLQDRTLRTERRDRLEAELRAHLEDAQEAGKTDSVERLGEPVELAGVFNAVSFRRDGISWFISAILLGLFAILVELMTVWSLSGFLSGTARIETHFPLDYALSPGDRLGLIIDLIAFAWFYPIFWSQARRAFRFAGKTRWRGIVAAIIFLFPALVHALSYARDPITYQYYFSNAVIVIGSFFLLGILSLVAYRFPDRESKPAGASRGRAVLCVLAAIYVLATTYAFHLRGQDGTLDNVAFQLPRAMIVLVYIRQIFEGAAGNVLNIALGFLAPAVRWSCIGSALTLWWGSTLVRMVLWTRRRAANRAQPVPFATILAFVYLTSILNAGAIDYPDVSFSKPVRLVSADIETRAIFPWPNLVRYFSRSNNAFPFYHTAWDETRGTFLIEQSAGRQSGQESFLIPTGQWEVDPSDSLAATPIRDTKNLLIQWPGGWGVSDPGVSLTPTEPDEDDVTLEELTARGFSCDTDEPFPSCFRLFYEGTELFSHPTRSIVVTNALVSPDGRWTLLTLTMRYSQQEYVYLLDLKKSP